MNGDGIMAEIKDLFHQGLSSTEIIAKGYARSTVYRVQSNVRGRRRNVQQAVPMLVTFDPEYQAERAAEAVRLRERVDQLEIQITQVVAETERLRSVIQELETTTAVAKEQGEWFLNKVTVAVNKIDGELDDLATVYEDNKNFFSEPAWQRRPHQAMLSEGT